MSYFTLRIIVILMEIIKDLYYQELRHANDRGDLPPVARSRTQGTIARIPIAVEKLFSRFNSRA